MTSVRRVVQNLYNCGKVCLSLLGTWSAGRGENWDANASTMLQARPALCRCASALLAANASCGSAVLSRHRHRAKALGSRGVELTIPLDSRAVSVNILT